MGASLESGDWETIQSKSDMSIIRNKATGEELQCTTHQFDSPELFNKQKAEYERRILKPLPFVAEVSKIEDSKITNMCSSFYPIKVFSEKIKYKLKDTRNIPTERGLLMLKDSAVGFNELKNQSATGLGFVLNDEMIGVNQKDEIRVWHNQRFSDNRPAQPMLFSTDDEPKFVEQLLKVYQSHLESGYPPRFVENYVAESRGEVSLPKLIQFLERKSSTRPVSQAPPPVSRSPEPTPYYNYEPVLSQPFYPQSGFKEADTKANWLPESQPRMTFKDQSSPVAPPTQIKPMYSSVTVPTKQAPESAIFRMLQPQPVVQSSYVPQQPTTRPQTMYQFSKQIQLPKQTIVQPVRNQTPVQPSEIMPTPTFSNIMTKKSLTFKVSPEEAVQPAPQMMFKQQSPRIEQSRPSSMYYQQPPKFEQPSATQRTISAYPQPPKVQQLNFIPQRPSPIYQQPPKHVNLQQRPIYQQEPAPTAPNAPQRQVYQQAPRVVSQIKTDPQIFQYPQPRLQQTAIASLRTIPLQQAIIQQTKPIQPEKFQQPVLTKRPLSVLQQEPAKTQPLMSSQQRHNQQPQMINTQWPGSMIVRAPQSQPLQSQQPQSQPLQSRLQSQPQPRLQLQPQPPQQLQPQLQPQPQRLSQPQPQPQHQPPITGGQETLRFRALTMIGKQPMQIQEPIRTTTASTGYVPMGEHQGIPTQMWNQAQQAGTAPQSGSNKINMQPVIMGSTTTFQPLRIVPAESSVDNSQSPPHAMIPEANSSNTSQFIKVQTTQLDSSQLPKPQQEPKESEIAPDQSSQPLPPSTLPSVGNHEEGHILLQQQLEQEGQEPVAPVVEGETEQPEQIE